MRPINIYAELTPNPNSLKFVADVMLLEGGAVEYNHPSEAVNCPLATQLFAFSGVNKVFITSNFITIGKASDIDWFDITNILREFIRGFLMSDEKLFLNSPLEEGHIPGKISGERKQPCAYSCKHESHCTGDKHYRHGPRSCRRKEDHGVAG